MARTSRSPSGEGQEVTDSSGRLEAGARAMARVRLHALADVYAELLTAWLRQAPEREQAAA